MAVPATPRLLVIDDDLAVRSMLTDVLRTLGYRVDEARDGVEGIWRLAESEYDLVLIDYLMAGMTGREVVEAVRRRLPAVKLIMLTGFATEEDVEFVRRQGLTVLVKPVGFGELSAAIQKVLNSPT